MATYLRPDEKQVVHIVACESGFLIVETAELWEEPNEGSGQLSYCCYPTVFDTHPFDTLERAQSAVRERYAWTRERCS